VEFIKYLVIFIRGTQHLTAIRGMIIKKFWCIQQKKINYFHVVINFYKNFNLSISKD